jgi:hypothetical protein
MFRLQINEGRRSAGRRKSNGPHHTNRCRHLPALRARRAPRTIRLREPPASGALAFRRSTAALTEVSRPRILDFRPGFLGRGCLRALPAHSCPSPADAPRAPAVIPADMMPEAARERFARPPAGTALAPPSGSHPECALRWARCFGFNLMQKRLSNVAAALGDVSPCKSLTRRLCSRETLDRNGSDTRRVLKQKTNRNFGKDSQHRMGRAKRSPSFISKAARSQKPMWQPNVPAASILIAKVVHLCRCGGDDQSYCPGRCGYWYCLLFATKPYYPQLKCRIVKALHTRRYLSRRRNQSEPCKAH